MPGIRHSLLLLPLVPALLGLGAPVHAQGSTDACAAAPAIGLGVTPYDTSAATTDGPAACAQISNDIWFLFTAPADATFRISLCTNTGYDAAMAIYPAAVTCPPGDLDAIDCNDDACGGGGPPIITLPMSLGETVRLQVGGWNGASGMGEIFIEELLPPAPGADILVGEIANYVQFGREGAEIGCAIASVTCNQGADPLDWYGNPDPRHPFITAATYRYEDGRFEQIGMSWAKHGFAAAQSDSCGLGCTPFPNGTRLGPGCSDVYGSGTNGFQGNLGPRSEIDPWTGAFDYSTSLLATTSGPFDSVERRMRIHDDDLDPALHPTAEYFCEVYVLAHDDFDHTDSLAWRPIDVFGSPGGAWNFNTSGFTTVGAAIHAWPGAQVVEVMDPGLDDGRVYLASNVIDLGNGTWRYEYAIQNLDLSRAIGTLTIPVAASITVSDVWFHAPAQFEPGFDDEPWSSERTANAVVWATDAAATATPQNPLRWGALYSFSFTADAAPESTEAFLGVHFDSPVPTLTATTVGPPVDPPGTPFIRGDASSDGLVDIGDAIHSLNCLFGCLPVCRDAFDANDDGQWNIADGVYTLQYLFTLGDPPPPPFPDCGLDTTPSVFLDCDSYSACP